ncbi:CehA/McbA family metallohydrolase [Anaerocolumna sp.]|uniref:CehA/McbA family metallohydrolase n=1 Tax=Anaerocolumna sp. TaxID=2041569 RepID=UPI0028A855C6|nr:CehA/McbA family metallohydrolase [Anaerocolumna sp.]
MKSMNKVKRKWISQILAVMMVLSTLFTAATPQHVLAEGSPVTLETESSAAVTDSRIIANVSDGSEITISTPIELDTTATVTGAAISFKVNDGPEKFYDRPFTLEENGISSEDDSATVTAYTYSTEDESIRSLDTEFTYIIKEESANKLLMGGAEDLFFSEYIEGSSNNKAIELYNGTGADVNLSGYSVLLYANGATTPTNTANLTGILENGKTYVIYNSSSVQAIKNVGNLSSQVANFNGDDALELRKNNIPIDVIGEVGVRINDYADKTLVRKSSIIKGSTTFSFSEWDTYPIDTFTYLGSHTMDGGTGNNDVAPVIGFPPSGSMISETQEITLSCPTEGASIFYRFNEEDSWIAYSDKITLNTKEQQITIYVMAEAEGKNAYNGTLTYTIQSENNIVPITTARAGSEGTNYLVKGVVTYVDRKSVYIQDSTAGIVARFAADQTFKQGDEIVVFGSVSTYNGLLQLNNAVLNGSPAVSVLPEPQVLTLAEAVANSEEYEAELIRINNVVLGEINTEGNTEISDGTNTMYIYKTPIPATAKKGDTVDVIAIMSQFSTSGIGGYQLIVVKPSDIIWVSSPAVAEVTATPSSGEVTSGTKITLACITEGAAIWYKLNGGTLTEYKAPFAITEKTTVEVYAKKDGIQGITSTFTYTIGDGKTSIAEARAIFADPKVPDKKVTVTGVVTFIDGNNVFMQDNTAGIDAYFSGGVSKPSGVAIGKELTVTGELTEYNGLLEVTKMSAAKVGDAKPLPEPKLVDLNKLDAAGFEGLESQRVRFEGVTLGTINTSGDTPITSTEGKTLNIYKMPALDGIVTGDVINVIGVIGQFNNYQLRVADKAHVTKATDKFGPAINTDNLKDVQKGKDYRVVVVVTDNTGVKEVKLTYIADGVTTKDVILTEKAAGQYEYTIPAAELTGTKLVLNFTATDTVEPPNVSTVSLEKSIVDLPRILSVLPADGSNTGEGEFKPSIIASFDNAGEEPNVAMKLDSAVIAHELTKSGDVYTATYNPLTNLTEGTHKVEITITRKDTKSLTYTWSFYVGKQEYNIYFGQLHAHTNLSDGAGEVEDAFDYAAKKAKNIDFLAITDHSNWLEDVAGTNNIADASKSTKWNRGKKAAADITKEVDDFVGIYGYEMTWSGGSIGHMNTFNTPGFENRNNAPFKTTTALKTYFDALKTQPQSMSMFNHPGKTFGDFGDFSYWDPGVDNLVNLIEVGNGEGPVRGSGYFPSYEYYVRALDKGWHIAPANNQDNHKGKWGDANTARTVVLASELTEESIYDAVRNRRVYSSEDNNLNIVYTLNNSIMGSIVSDTEGPVNISVDINDPDKEAIGKVEVVVNGGMVVDSKNVTTHEETVEFTIPSNYSYYFIRIIQADKDIAVTAPVWVGNVEKCGISKSEVNKELCMKNEEIEITTSYYNNESLPLIINKLEYSIGGKVIQTLTGLEAVSSLGQGKATIKYTSPVAGSVNIDVKLYATMDGVEKVFTDVVKIDFQDPSVVTKVIVDGTHFNDYVYGYYSNNMGNLIKIAAEEMIQVQVVTDKITPEMLEDAGMLIISVPARWSGHFNYENKPVVVSPFSNEFIAMVKDYADKGGNVIICGISDREDRSSEIGTQASTQINKLLAGIGSTTRINSDEGTDFTTNSGQEYRLHFTNFNMNSEFLNEVVEGQKYSFYKGCSVILDPAAVTSGKVQWLVKGHSTTETKNITSYDGNYVPQTMGNVVALASEQLDGGGFLLVGGSVFMSNFEVQAELDNFGDLQNSNYNIVLNALKKSKKDITITPISEARKGKLGEVYTIEGYVTAGTETGNAFFDTIYIQDATGGMDIFPINEPGIKLGQKVRVTGTLAEYENDMELMVMIASVIDTNINLIEPELVTTADAANYEKSGGKLIKVHGKVTKVERVEGTVSYFMVEDESGVPIRVFINGYILSSTGNDSTTKLKEGDVVSAIGLSSMDTEGVRIRVRDRAEIVLDEIPPVRITDIAEVREGKVDEVYTVEGYVTAGTKAGNAFADIIYVQDATGGISVNTLLLDKFEIKLGQKIRITGKLNVVENDWVLTASEEEIIGSEIKLMEPDLVTIADAANYKKTGGKLIKVYGEVTRVERVEDAVTSFMVKGENGVSIRVFINGYILSSTGYDPTTELKEGDMVTAIGLASMDTEGVRIRVRDRAEIVLDEIPPVRITDIAEVREGKVDEVYTVEGYVTAGTKVGNTFADIIYIQDTTGGISVSILVLDNVKLGQKIRITGKLNAHENDLVLIAFEEDLMDPEINLIKPELVTTADAANYDKTGGKLIKVQGKVTKVEKVKDLVSSFIVKDESGVSIRVFINDYIISSTGKDQTTNLKAGDMVTAIGLASMDKEGVRIRVRDRAEIVITKPTDPTDPGVPPVNPPSGTGVESNVSVEQNVSEDGTKHETITTKTSVDSKGNQVQEITKVIMDRKTNKVLETITETRIADRKTGSTLRMVITKGEKKEDIKREMFIEAGISASSVKDNKAMVTLNILPEYIMEQFKTLGGKVKVNVSVGMNTSKLTALLKDKKVNEVNITIPIPEEITSQDKIIFNEIILGKDIINEARKQKQTIRVVVTDDKKQEIYSITFDGKELGKSKEVLEDVNVSLEILQPNKRNKIFNLINSTIPDNAKHRGLVLELKQKGDLPVTAKVKVYVGNQKGFVDGDKVYVYLFNEKASIGKNLYDFRLEETTTSSLVISKGGFIEMNIQKGGSYVLMPKKAKQSIVAVNTNKAADAKKETKTK